MKIQRTIAAVWVMIACATGMMGICPAFGEAPPDYYRLAQGKTGRELQQALHFIVRGHRAIPYSDATRLDTSDALKELDQDPGETNNVRLIYSGSAMRKTEFGNTGGWNREHLWPNSYGLNDQMPAFSDLHNLRAVDATVNSSRGNKWFDVSDTNDAAYRLPGHPEAPGTSTDSDSWEPPDNERGDIVRALFYMAVRYAGDTAGEPALTLTDRTDEVGSNTNLMARLTTLLIWHVVDPVDERERARNDLVFERYQGNRNPFIDHPEWVLLAFGPRLGIFQTNGQTGFVWQAEFTLPVLETALSPDGPWKTYEGFGQARQPPLNGDGNRFFRLIAR